ncbi:sugar ABC transporter substrate-binding protein [Rhizobium sp. CC-YZS058]|uniref:ABC transporter substrate-binding protein n=1 Tax=Rhizobium sp. CC-YZS058 TaxID=3042153 RepID=UPI002B05B72C|nr:sugar ABC transporter substrate-binding protein [Rhizobium sp. CC-YZS058]MEA3537007.1 sugar ABC transporter substrate-binding protein [Rhizobium sp. CC-YZS058]
MKRRGFLTLSAALAASVFSTGAYAIDWKAQSGQEITVLLSEHPWTAELRKHIDGFEAETGIKVKIDAFAEDLYSDRMNLAVRSTQSVADVYMIQMDSALYTQWEAGVVEPLTPYLDDPVKTDPAYDLTDYPEGFRAGASFPVGGPDPQLYAIPISFEAYTLFYNKELVDRYLNGKVPATMDELVAAANEISAKGEGKIFGASMRGKRSAELVDTMTGIVLDAWGDQPAALPYNIWFDGAWTKPRFDDPRIAKGLSYYAGLLKAGPPSALAYGWEDASRFFSQGNAAFFIDASVFGPGFEDPKTSAIAGKVGYASLPPSEGSIGYSGHWSWGISIAKNSPKKDAAWLFVQWATNKHMTAALGVATGGAPRDSAWADADYVKALNAGYVAAVKDQMQHTSATSVFRQGWSDVVLLIVDAIHQMYQGTSPEDAVAELQTNVKDTLE